MTKKARDAEFERFFAAEHSRLERFATMLTGDPVRGGELTQEALARVYARWRRVRSGSPGGYARQIITNLVRGEHRASKLRTAKPTPRWARETKVPAADEHVIDSMRVVDALSSLPPVRRATVLLRFQEDLTEAEIARLLDRPLGTVKSDIHRALRQLRPLWESADRGVMRR